ncbi:MAG: F-type H+-transporting ATPase subunit b [Candidatus Deianiraeaceae bacterium]
MPQFELSTYSSQIFWLLICFGIFFSYVKFFFLPKLDGILSKRNDEIRTVKDEIAKNNAQTKDNLQEAENSARKSRILADKIISDAEDKASANEEKALKDLDGARKSAINEIMENQKRDFSQEAIDKAVIEVAEVVINKIGIQSNADNLQEIVANK